MNTEKTLKTILLLSVLPLVYALIMALYFKFNLSDLNTASFKFSRLNSYIYAHSYGALLLAVFCGINIGQNLAKSDKGLILCLNFILLLLAWLSHKSFADWQGMVFLIFCWVSLVVISTYTSSNQTPDKLKTIRLSIQLSIIALLSLITLING